MNFTNIRPPHYYICRGAVHFFLSRVFKSMKYLPSYLYTIAGKKLSQDVESELEIPDPPDPETAIAANEMPPHSGEPVAAAFRRTS